MKKKLTRRESADIARDVMQTYVYAERQWGIEQVEASLPREFGFPEWVSDIHLEPVTQKHLSDLIYRHAKVHG